MIWMKIIELERITWKEKKQDYFLPASNKDRTKVNIVWIEVGAGYSISISRNDITRAHYMTHVAS